MCNALICSWLLVSLWIWKDAVLAAFEGNVAAATVFADLFLEAGAFVCIEGPSEEAFGDIIDSLLSGMAHVFCIEAVVTELVHDNLVSREVVGEIERIHAQVGRKSCKKIVDAEQKG